MFYLDLFTALEKHRIRYLLVGGLALNLHGVERATMDIDFMLGMDDVNLAQFVVAARELGLKPVAPVPLEAMLNPQQRQHWIEDKHLVAFALCGNGPAVPTVDIILNPSVAFADAWERRVEKDMGNFRLSLASVTDLIASKRNTGRLKDASDIEALEKVLRLSA